MAQLSTLPLLRAPGPQVIPGERQGPAFLFQSLEAVPGAPGNRGGVFLGSVLLHGALILAVVMLPLYLYDSVPAASERVLRAFFVPPPDVAVPLPPPPPPAGPSLRPRALKAVPAPAIVAAFVAPLEVPDRIVADPTNLGDDQEGGVPGGVEGGVPGGVIGGVVGGLPSGPPVTAAPEPIVRIGGAIAAPALVQVVRPEYPEVARLARVRGLVILEAVVSSEGKVESARVLRGVPLLDEPALKAVRERRYRPLLLNGVPTPFILTVTVSFDLGSGELRF